MGIGIVDSIIVSYIDWFSFRESGYL